MLYMTILLLRCFTVLLPAFAILCIPDPFSTPQFGLDHIAGAQSRVDWTARPPTYCSRFKCAALKHPLPNATVYWNYRYSEKQDALPHSRGNSHTTSHLPAPGIPKQVRHSPNLRLSRQDRGSQSWEGCFPCLGWWLRSGAPVISLHSPPDARQVSRMEVWVAPAPTPMSSAFKKKLKGGFLTPGWKPRTVCDLAYEFWAELMVDVGSVGRGERGMGASSLWELPGTGNRRHWENPTALRISKSRRKWKSCRRGKRLKKNSTAWQILLSVFASRKL